MYTSYEKQDTFQTIVLENKKEQTYMEVVPERGAIISRYVYRGQEIFYLEQDTLADLSKNIRGGNPVLFPISSYLTDETYSYGGKDYKLKQHGFARNLSAKVMNVQTNERGGSITLEMKDNEETLQRYPFGFKLLLTYTLSSNGLEVLAEVHNPNEQTMPFYLGYHPYFYVADKQALEISVPSNNYDQMIANSVLQDGAFNLVQPESNAIYDHLQGKTSSMIDRKRGVKVNITSDDVFSYVVLWALAGKDFVCIEPWMAPVDGMNVNKGIQLLPPGETHRSIMHIQPELI